MLKQDVLDSQPGTVAIADLEEYAAHSSQNYPDIVRWQILAFSIFYRVWY